MTKLETPPPVLRRFCTYFFYQAVLLKCVWKKIIGPTSTDAVLSAYVLIFNFYNSALERGTHHF